MLADGVGDEGTMAEDGNCIDGALEAATGTIWLSLIHRWVCCVALKVRLLGVVGINTDESAVDDRLGAGAGTGRRAESTVLIGKAGGGGKAR